MCSILQCVCDLDCSVRQEGYVCLSSSRLLAASRAILLIFSQCFLGGVCTAITAFGQIVTIAGASV